MQAVIWQTINGEFTQNSMSKSEDIEQVKATARKLNLDLKELGAANFHWHVGEVKEVEL